VFKLDPVDLAGDTLAEEAERGGVSTGSLGESMETLALPVTPLPSLEAGVFSADGRYRLFVGIQATLDFS
jgi:hypothetical protein